jgi:D-3-phosphoglycerate dehydrogenase / 2-oxoglutarate reductase
MAAKVLVTDHVFADLETERAILEPHDAELVLADSTDEDALVEAAGDADAILVCFAKLPEAVVAAAADGGCRIISRYGIGYDNIDIDAATERGLLVTYVPDYCLDEVADHSLALMLALARGVHHAALAVREGEWAVPHGAVHRLRGRRLAVIGVGGVGVRVAERARAFGIETVGVDPYVEDWSKIPAERAESFEDAVAEADFVSLHVPLTPESHHLVDADAIAGMQRAPIIVNTARGPLVDADAAVEALDSGALGGVALDVTEDEPPAPDHPLRSHPRAVLTPHMAFYSVEAQAELQRRAAEEVARALAGEPPDRAVNPEVLASPGS